MTGASGKTGRLVFEALRDESSTFDARALVRGEKSARALRKWVPETGLDQIVICDVTKLAKNGDDVPSGLEGCEAMIICTSAIPVINKMSLMKSLVKAPINLIRGKKMMDFRSLKFDWKGGQYPELVDYQGQLAQIDLAKKLGIKHVVVVGSMGGTDPNNFLNFIGKNQDGSGNGDILVWKRKAEKYLVESGLDYTIIHPGGLRDDPPGEKKFVIDINDKLLRRQQKSISRGDVANLCVAALTVGKGRKVAFDVITADETAAAEDDDDDDSSASTGSTAEEALEAFLAEKKVYAYA